MNASTVRPGWKRRRPAARRASLAAGTLRAMLYTGGAVATAAGLHTVVAGARSFPGERELAEAQIESEVRFYGAFYAAYGVGVLRTARRAERDPAAVRALAATLLLAGLGRAGAWVATAKPLPVQRMLLAIELVAPPVLVALQERAARP